MDDKALWRMFYLMLASWNHHPKGNIATPQTLGVLADVAVADFKQQEQLRWPDGQQLHKPQQK